MATTTNHVDRLIPWLLEVTDQFALLDEVDWSLTPTIVQAVQGPQLLWSLVLSTKSPLLGQPPLVAPTFIEFFQLVEFEFKNTVLEGLNLLVKTRDEILSTTQ